MATNKYANCNQNHKANEVVIYVKNIKAKTTIFYVFCQEVYQKVSCKKYYKKV